MTLASFVNRYDEHGGGDLAFVLLGLGRRARVRAASARWRRSTASCSSSRRGRCGTSASTSRSARSTATTSTCACRSGRPARKVVTADFRAIHHRPLRDAPDPERMDRRAHPAWPRSGTAGCPASAHAPGTWRERALRAEAERDAARALAHSTALEIEARDGDAASTRSPRRAPASRGGITAPLRLFRRPRPATGCGWGGSHADDAGRAPAIACDAHPRARRLRRARATGHRARGASPGPPVFAFAALGSVCRSYNLILDQRPVSADLEAARARRPRTPRSPIATSARRSGARSPILTSALVGCAGASGVQSVAWWEAQRVRRPTSSTATTSTAAASCDAYGWARGQRRRPRSNGGRAAARAVALGRPRAALRRGAAPGCRLRGRLRAARAPGRAQGRGRRPARDRPPRHRSGRRSRRLGRRGTSRSPRSGTARLPGAPPRPEDWKQRARLAEAEREAARAQAYSVFSRREAQLVPLERELTAITRRPAGG